MMTSIHCSIVSAEQEIFAGTVQRVVATGSLGDIGVYPGHTPLLTGIQPGPVKLTMEDGSEEMFFASGGFLEVQPTSICASVPAMSVVSVLVIVCTDIGASPPTGTDPTIICLHCRRSMVL